MIGRIRGILAQKQPPDILVEVGGVGYELQVPMTTLFQLPELGSEVTLVTHFVVREDAQLLYGFIDERDRALFRQLIKVSGVGPKLALTILSGMDASSFARCVQRDDELYWADVEVADASDGSVTARGTVLYRIVE